jgi:hypothetical protein
MEKIVKILGPYEKYFNKIKEEYDYELPKDVYDYIVDYLVLCSPSKFTVDEYLNVNCKECTNCVCCIGCANCVDCFICLFCRCCIDCQMCERCVECSYSKRCMFCKYSDYCEQCENCHCCNYCTNLLIDRKSKSEIVCDKHDKYVSTCLNCIKIRKQFKNYSGCDNKRK